jgi:hypothetical protein
MIITPMLYKWDGAAFTPTPYFKAQAEKQLQFGRTYRLEAVEIRSSESHKHYFACINTAFDNLPEAHANRWQTPDQLRKWALCQTPFRDTQEFHAPSHAEAIRLATHFAQLREFSVCEIRDNMVLRHTPHSQDYAQMADREFQASKSAVLDVLANILGVPAEDLAREGGKAA